MCIHDSTYRSSLQSQCVGEFSGEEIADGDVVSCDTIPVNKDAKYTAISAEIALPDALSKSLCKTTGEAATLEFCILTAVCDENCVPTIATSFNFDTANCILKQDAVASSTIGISYAIGQASELTLDSFSSGIRYAQ